MIKTFDYFNQPELPYIILCNPDKTEIYSLGLSYNTNLKLRYNAISEFNFVFPQSIDSGETILPQYDHIKNKKLILIENYGYFIINNVAEAMNGSTPVKKVSCSSLEYELISKRVFGYGGTVKLHDPISPSGTLLDTILSYAPNWNVGDIDTSLEIQYRTFNVADTNVYNFLMGEVSSAFECIFIFDTDNRTISAKSYANATSESDIFLSFDNLIDNAEISEKTDEITTCLSVYGGGGLDIRSVNPLGTNSIYDFSYYATSEWMSDGLISSITNWQALLASKQSEYTDLLYSLITYNSELISLESTLSTYQSEYLALEGVQKVRIQGGLPYSDITAQMVAKQAEIDAQEILISNKQTFQIDPTLVSIQEINSLVSFDNNFTPSQLLELNNFIYENTFQNENIIKTDLMTTVEIQDAQQSLYDQGKNVLARISQPRYEITFEAVNYLDLPEFSTFSSQTELGSVFFVELSEDRQLESVLLEMSIVFDNPIDFSMTFSNRLRLDNGKFVYSDLFGNAVKTGSNVAFNSLKWSNWENNYKDDVSTFITSALDTTTNNLINNSSQEILINQNGLRGRTIIEGTSTYEPTQVWLTSSVLAFSDDSFSTSKLALGKVTVGGISKYGLVADVVVGRLLAGNSLSITNEGSNFLLDASGATLTNAKFTITNTNSKILLNPSDTEGKVFRIQKNDGAGTFNDKFWVDNSGNVNFSGVLSGATGTFSGALSAATGTFSGALSGATGTFSGSLSAASGTFIGNISGASGTFTGNIQADRLLGSVSWTQLTDIPASKLESGVMRTGTLLQWPGGVTATSYSSGIFSLSAPRLEITATNGSGSYIFLDDNLINMGVASVYIGGNLELEGNLYTNSPSGSYPGYGLNISLKAKTLGGADVILRFDNGILTSYEP